MLWEYERTLVSRQQSPNELRRGSSSWLEQFKYVALILCVVNVHFIGAECVCMFFALKYQTAHSKIQSSRVGSVHYIWNCFSITRFIEKEHDTCSLVPNCVRALRVFPFFRFMTSSKICVKLYTVCHLMFQHDWLEKEIFECRTMGVATWHTSCARRWSTGTNIA